MFLLTLILALFINLSPAQEFTYDQESQSVIPRYLAKVILLKGVATHKAGEELKVGDKIYPQETIVTKQKSLIKLEMVDMTMLTIGPKSSLSFEKWKYKSKSERVGLFNLNLGKMRANFKVKAHKEDALKIKAAHVSMGVRGTEVTVNHLKNNDKDGRPITIAHFATIKGSTLIYDEIKDIELEQKASEHYISIIDSQNKIKKSSLLTFEDQEWNKLKAQDINARKYFKPLLKSDDYLMFNSTKEESTLTDPTLIKSRRQRKRKEKEKPSWKDTLKKLNSRLKN